MKNCTNACLSVPGAGCTLERRRCTLTLGAAGLPAAGEPIPLAAATAAKPPAPAAVENPQTRKHKKLPNFTNK